MDKEANSIIKCLPRKGVGVALTGRKFYCVRWRGNDRFLWNETSRGWKKEKKITRHAASEITAAGEDGRKTVKSGENGSGRFSRAPVNPAPPLKVVFNGPTVASYNHVVGARPISRPVYICGVGLRWPPPTPPHRRQREIV